jgi:cellulose synthase/poly-beta-1,6-N-acetylglucosamine synthase-like glycosyltransferase
VSTVLLVASVAAVVWTYVLFPAVTALLGAVRRRPVHAGAVTPTVCVVIAAYNEEKDIGAKLANVLEQDYPADRLDVVVAADGCTDGTEDVVRGFEHRGIRLLSRPRGGKAAALNAAIASTDAEVLVLSDANSMLAPGALRALVAPFADPSVGGVAGDQRYLPEDGAAVESTGERSYWSMDRLLKQSQSSYGSVTSATGSLYAIRRDLVQPVVDGVTDDFWTSTAVVEAHRRLVFAPAAIAFEPPASSDRAEYARKVRIMTRGLRGVYLRRGLLNPFRYGFYAVQLFSHKVARRLMVLPLLGVLVGSALRPEPLWQAFAALQVLGYAAGGLGLALRARGLRSGPLAIPAFFVMVNVASARAVWNVLSGRRIDRWQTARSAPVAPPTPAGGIGRPA